MSIAGEKIPPVIDCIFILKAMLLQLTDAVC